MARDSINNSKKLFRDKYNYIYCNKEFLFGGELGHRFIISFEVLGYIEDILLSESPYNETDGYNKIEELKKNKRYLNSVKSNIVEIQSMRKQLEGYTKQIGYYEIDMHNILNNLYHYVYNQASDIYNRDKKLIVIDEYIRVSRFSNDGITWEGGYYPSGNDIKNTVNKGGALLEIPKCRRQDYGVENNSFINIFSNDCHFTEEEKKQIYDSHHGEDKSIELRCVSSKDKIKRSIYTSNCNKYFILNVDDVYYDYNSKKFFTLCPNCGYMVLVNDSLLSESNKNLILNRTSDYDYMIKYSESQLMGLHNMKETGKKLKKELKIFHR